MSGTPSDPGRFSILQGGAAQVPAISPELQAILLPIEDKALQDKMTRAYYTLMEGDPSSITVQLAILLSGLVYATTKSTESQTRSNLNSANGQADLRLDQLSKLNKLLADLPALISRSAVTGQESLQRDIAGLRSLIEQTRKDEQEAREAERRREEEILAKHFSPTPSKTRRPLLMFGSKVGVGVLIGLLIGGFVVSRLADARIDRLVSKFSYAARVESFLDRSGGSLRYVDLPVGKDGKPGTQGVIVNPGRLTIRDTGINQKGEAFVAFEP